MKRPPRKQLDNKKLYLIKRDGNKCLCCGTHTELTFDHIVPVSLGGTWANSNLQLLCRKCNSEKATDIIIYSTHNEIMEYINEFFRIYIISYLLFYLERGIEL